MRIISALALITIFICNPTFAGYRYNFTLNQNMKSQIENPGNAESITYMCEAHDSEWNWIGGKCENGSFTGEDSMGNPVSGTCLKGHYTIFYGVMTISDQCAPN